MTSSKITDLKQLFTVSEVAEAWKKRPQFVRDLINAGHLGAYRVGVELRVSDKHIAEFLERHISLGLGTPVSLRTHRPFAPETAITQAVVARPQWQNSFGTAFAATTARGGRP